MLALHLKPYWFPELSLLVDSILAKVVHQAFIISNRALWIWRWPIINIIEWVSSRSMADSPGTDSNDATQPSPKCFLWWSHSHLGASAGFWGHREAQATSESMKLLHSWKRPWAIILWFTVSRSYGTDVWQCCGNREKGEIGMACITPNPTMEVIFVGCHCLKNEEVRWRETSWYQI